MKSTISMHQQKWWVNFGGFGKLWRSAKAHQSQLVIQSRKAGKADCNGSPATQSARKALTNHRPQHQTTCPRHHTYCTVFCSVYPCFIISTKLLHACTNECWMVLFTWVKHNASLSSALQSSQAPTRRRERTIMHPSPPPALKHDS